MKDELLLVDIGNTTIDLLYKGKGERKREKIPPEDQKSMIAFLHSLPSSSFSCYISSVDKKGLFLFLDALKSIGIEGEVLSPSKMKETSQRLSIRVDNTEYLGSDLFCDILARENKDGLLVIDCGTASKLLLLDDKNVFHGALILPGIALFPKALSVSTDLLSDTRLTKKPPLLSLKTEECLSSGALNGQAAMFAGLVKKVKEEYSLPHAKVLLTGGNSYLIKDLLPEFGLEDFEWDQNAVLEGLARSYGSEDYLSLKE